MAVRGVSVPEWWGEPLKDRCSIQGWIKQVDSAATLAEWNDERTAKLAYLSLRGKSMQWALNQTYDDPNKWNTWNGAGGLKLALQNRYTRRQTLSEITSLRESLLQGQNELVVDYYDRVHTTNYLIDSQQWEPVVLNQAGDNNQAVENDKLSRKKHHKINVMNDFAHGLREDIKSLVMIQDPQTPDDMLAVSLRVEASLNDRMKNSQNTQLLQVQAIRNNPNNDRSRFIKRNKENDTCHNCGKKGHWAPECEEPRRQNFMGSRGRGRGRNGRGGRTYRPQGNYKAFEVSNEGSAKMQNEQQSSEKTDDFAQSAQIQAFVPSPEVNALIDTLNPYRL